jgi:hypothetical protein
MSVTDSGTLHHTCFVVNDIEKTAEALANAFDIKWNVWALEPADSTVHGKKMPISMRIALAQIGEMSFELIEPRSDESIYAEHLGSKGEGFHHICIIYPSAEAVQAARDELLRQGREMVQSVNLGEPGEFYYFDLKETDSILEVLYLNGEKLPAPEMSIG